MKSPSSFSKIKSYLQLIRWPNLIIVALTQYLLYYFVLLRFLGIYGFNPVLDIAHFSLLVLVTVIIAAIGYIANDEADLEMDKINKPDAVIIEKKIDAEQVAGFKIRLLIAGTVLSVYLSWYVSQWYYFFFFPAAVAGLELYARNLKKKAIVGNLLVAGFCTGVVGIVFFPDLMNIRAMNIFQNVRPAGLDVFWAYLGFAFHATMYREVVKDMEDVDGDSKAGCKTLPIIGGILISKIFAALWAVLLLSAFYNLLIRMSQSATWLTYSIGIILVILPTIYSMLLLLRADSKKDFHTISQLIKIVMLGGLVILLFY